INDSMEVEVKSTISAFIEQMQKTDGAVLKIICKSIGPSSLEAMTQAINQIPYPKNVSLKIIHGSVGDVAESDLALAQASQAIIM
ncbi:hypothetical protein KAZ93_04620, partial [Patescibacteria group bacterium]|nr:hypothetical protein [Patescibacteria group bacterium]